jgi:hypothetical protein
MKKFILRYGFISLLIGAAIFLLMLVVGKSLSFKTQEVLGYVSIISSLSLVFFGIKQYRDKENGGSISFGKALGLGMLITVFVAIGFAIIDYIYTAYINPDFAQQYLEYSISELEKSLSGEDLVQAKEKLTNEMESFTSLMGAIFMFGIVTVIGFIISLISSLVLNKK